MHYFSFLLLFLLLTTTLPAQIHLQFRKVDAPIPNLGFQVTACLQDRTYTTDSMGMVDVVFPEACTELRIRFQDITYGTFDSVFMITNTNAELVITLKEVERDIDEVRIEGYYSNIKETARGREYKINTEKYLANTPIPQALQRLPNFTKSGDGVLIEGKTAAPRYYLDGKEVPIEIVQVLDIQSVDRIEVRESAADPDKEQGGEIWIYRKKNANRFLSGNIDAALDSDFGENIGYSVYPSLGFQSPKFEVNALASYIDRPKEKRIDYRFQRKGHSDSLSDVKYHSNDRFTRTTLQMSYNFTNSFSVQCVGFLNIINRKGKTTSYLDKSYSNKRDHSEFNTGAALSLEYIYNPDNRFYLIGDYLHDQDYYAFTEYNRKYELEQKDNNIAAEFKGIHDNLFSAWATNHNLEYSYRYIARSGATDGTINPQSFVQRLTLEDLLEFPLGVSLLLSLALDYDRYDYGEKKLDLWSPVPLGAVSFGGQWGRVNLVYSRQVKKPTLWHLDPRSRYKDRREATRGNPMLQPATYNSYTVRYSKRFGTQSIALRLEYQDLHDIIEPIYTNDDFENKYYNVGRMQIFSPRISYQAAFFDYTLFLYAYGGVNFQNVKLTPYYEKLSRGKVQKGRATVANLRLEYQFADRFSVETWLGHWGRGYSLYSYDDPIADLGASFEARFLKSRDLKVYLSMGDILAFWLKDDYKRELYDFVEQRHSTPTATISLGLSYRFGKEFESRLSDPRIAVDDQMSKSPEN